MPQDKDTPLYCPLSPSYLLPFAALQAPYPKSSLQRHKRGWRGDPSLGDTA